MSSLQAGAARVDITPELGCHMCGYFQDRLADDVHSPLFAKAIALSDGTTTIGFVVCDLIALPREVTDAAKAMIAAETGVPPSNVLIAGTHTHYGPALRGALGTPAQEGYAEWVPRKIADAFVIAHRRLEPAQVGHGSGACPTEVHCRRWHMKDGSVRMNPGYQNPECVRPEGPTDPELGVLVVRTLEGKPIAVMGNLALHYVGGGPATWISADYFGAFGEALRRCAGDEFVAIMANGCFGDINNCNFSRPAPHQPYPYANVERVANVAAGEAWKVWNTLREDDFAADVTLGASLEDVRYEARTPSEQELAAARARLEGPEQPNDTDWVYARELVMIEDMPSSWTVPLHALRVGGLGIVGLPGEVFARIGLGIKKASPLDRTMVVGLANDSVGYVGTDDAIRIGGYETRLCRHVRTPVGTADLWTETATRLLTDLSQG